MDHMNYLKYVLRHKWYVFIACLKCDVSLTQAIFHDSSKFSFIEWFAYVNTFYTKDGGKQYKPTDLFDYAWNNHQKVNKHHWQYWVLIMDSGDIKPLKMPEKYAKEMVADWMGAGKAITGKWEFREWYFNNKEKMIIHDHTRSFVENLINFMHIELTNTTKTPNKG